MAGETGAEIPQNPTEAAQPPQSPESPASTTQVSTTGHAGIMDKLRNIFSHKRGEDDRARMVIDRDKLRQNSSTSPQEEPTQT